LASAAGEPWKVGERGARALRSELGLGDAPIDIRDVIRRRGVQLAVQAFPEEWGDGRYLKKGNRHLILLNSAIGDANRARFTAAHELGHHELHQDNQEVVVYIDTNVHAPAQAKSDAEREADAFAAHLMAPSEALRRDLHGIPGKEITPETIVQLMMRYGLSYTSLVYRIHNAELMSATSRNRLLAQGEGHVRELRALYPARDDDEFFLNPQLPGQYRAAVLKLYEQRHITLERLAELLRIDPEEAGDVVRKVGIEREPGLEPDERAVAELRALAERDSD
jgi:Zn-dependent peptidase ImmA (M78 family)